jgi:hypothetical protein
MLQLSSYLWSVINATAITALVIRAPVIKCFVYQCSATVIRVLVIRAVNKIALAQIIAMLQWTLDSGQCCDMQKNLLTFSYMGYTHSTLITSSTSVHS